MLRKPNPVPAARRVWAGAAAIAAAVWAWPAAAEAQAQLPDASGCTVAADGTLECGTIEIHGTLRNIVMVTFSREGLGIRLLELRQSFLEDIIESVNEGPF